MCVQTGSDDQQGEGISCFTSEPDASGWARSSGEHQGTAQWLPGVNHSHLPCTLAEGFVLQSSGPCEGLPWCEVCVHLKARGGTRLPDLVRC